MKNHNVLILDDEPQNIELAELILKKEGYNLFFSKDYSEASQYLEKEKIDVLVLDLMLPDRDGFSILEELKSKQRHKQLEIIVVSALNDDASKLKALDLGAHAYIAKPYDIISLKSTVKQTLTKSKLSQLSIEDFLHKSFKKINEVLDEKEKKKSIIEFLNKQECKLDLEIVMSYLLWFSSNDKKDFMLNEKCLSPFSFLLVGEPILDLLHSSMNKVLIRPYLKEIHLEEKEVFDAFPSYF